MKGSGRTALTKSSRTRSSQASIGRVSSLPPRRRLHPTPTCPNRPRPLGERAAAACPTSMRYQRTRTRTSARDTRTTAHARNPNGGMLAGRGGGGRDRGDSASDRRPAGCHFGGERGEGRKERVGNLLLQPARRPGGHRGQHLGMVPSRRSRACATVRWVSTQSARE